MTSDSSVIVQEPLAAFSGAFGCGPRGTLVCNPHAEYWRIGIVLIWQTQQNSEYVKRKHMVSVQIYIWLYMIF